MRLGYQPSIGETVVSELHTLYRFFDRSGGLLYVGITSNPAARFAKHKGEKEWWLDVARIDMEHHSSRTALAAAEAQAIRAERPLHNIRGNRPVVVQRLEEAALPRGLERNEVYALALTDGSCPVGLVVSGDSSGVILDLYSWMVQRFTVGEEWVSAESISRWRKADKRVENRPDGKYTIFEMDALGDYQTQWVNLYERVAEASRP